MRSAGRRCGLVMILVAGVVYTCLMSSAFLVGVTVAKAISGRVEKCSNDGEHVNVPILGKDSCYRCFCRKGRVECENNKCPSLEGCHAILFSRPKGHCCNVCKGCLVGESYLASGDVWSSTEDNCVINTCQAGVLTSSREECRPPCTKPRLLPGQCCPTCSGCYHDGIEHLDGEVFTLKQNPSVQCVCKQGDTTCSKRLCPVLNCPEEKIYFERGHKCPKCRGERMVFDTPRSCFFAKRVFAGGERHMLDNCTSCVCVRWRRTCAMVRLVPALPKTMKCSQLQQPTATLQPPGELHTSHQQGTMMCDRQQCPEIACPPKDQITAAGVCCPTCRTTLPCLVGNVTMKHEETWQPDVCTTCTCRDGAARCAPKWCSHTSICPEDYRLRYRENQCCPVCTRNDGVCTLRGQTSDVIDTFDGRTYTIDGFCTHDLIRDCGHGQLAVKVKYKTKLGYQKHVDIVTIRFGSTSIKLYKSSEIRINRTNLFSNHFSSNNFSLNIQPSHIIVKVKVGLHVHWNLKDRLSIKVSGNYFRSGGLCGLCGDFDGDESNDLVNKKGNQVEDPSLMAYTWVRGKLCRQHLSETGHGPSVGRKNAFSRHQYHKRRLVAKHGHQHQRGVLDLPHTEPNKTLQVLREDRSNFRNDTSGKSLNQAASLLNYSFTSEYSETAQISNSSEFNIEPTETVVHLDAERENINSVTERTVPAVFNISVENDIKSPETCQHHTREWMQAQDDCQKVNNMKLEKCGAVFEEVSFVRSCADVLCACLKDQLCKETAMNTLLLPCRANHKVNMNPPS